ncbi:hypothetical protein [Streptomyces odontomachi]|uniref:hypothetical protein n=1 Tax=Streptomyces odontomachi TaxID=2944940 RepID=UPI002109A3B4|nr:hypothetical protein [Streptomyces sp. ODS25]
MQSTRKPFRVRTALVACTCAGLLAGGAGAAFATPAAASHAPQGTTTQSPSPSPTAAASITLLVVPSTATAGDTVVMTGQTKGLNPGDELTVEMQGSNGQWKPLDNVKTTVNHDGRYNATAKLTTKGTVKVRVVHGSTASTPVSVTVN